MEVAIEGGIIYCYCISKHITRKTTVVLFKMCVSAPEIGAFSMSVLRIGLGSIIMVMSFLTKSIPP